LNRAEAEEFLQRHREAVLATIRKDGRPQLSNVLVAYKDGKLLISTTEDRAKYHNLVRDPRCTVLVLGDNFWQYLTVDGTASFTRMPEALGPLREYYQLASGPHPNWDEYDEAMRRERRVLVTVSIESMYPLT
jgi:PPOX class probable F420-dependent enzyme